MVAVNAYFGYLYSVYTPQMLELFENEGLFELQEAITVLG